MNFDEIRDQAVNGLFERADQVKAVPPPSARTLFVKFDHLRASEKKRIVCDVSSAFESAKPSLYAIMVERDFDHRAAWQALAAAKSGKLDDRAYSRVLPFAASDCLYVGSSQNLPQRLLGHFGFGASKTYSLHLAAWAADFAGSLRIDALQFPDIGSEALCALEDQLAECLRPMFGRRGSV